MGFPENGLQRVAWVLHRKRHNLKLGNDMEKNENKQEPFVLETLTRTGEIPVTKDKIFVFPVGIPAFEEYHQFVLYCDLQFQPFFFLKSVGISPEISFVCIDPFMVCPEYKVRLGSADIEILGLACKEDAFVFSMVTVRDNPEDITTNLVGPVVLNLKNSLGKQVINECKNFGVRTRIWERVSELSEEKKENEACLVQA